MVSSRVLTTYTYISRSLASAPLRTAMHAGDDVSAHVEYISSHGFTIGRVIHSVDTRKRHHSVSFAPHCNDNATDEISEEVGRRRRDELNRKRKADEKKNSAVYLWKLNTVTNSLRDAGRGYRKHCR